jgi:hypothetical protein
VAIVVRASQLGAHGGDTMNQRFFSTTLACLGLLAVACGDDTSQPTTTGTTTGGGGSGNDGGAGGNDGGGGSTGGGGSAPVEVIGLVRGTFEAMDLAQAQMIHDQGAAQAQDAAEAAGDYAHEVFLGTTILGTTENEFVALDRWSAAAGAQAFYGSPEFQAGLDALLEPAPTPEVFEHQPTWYNWGDLDSADAADPRFVIVVRGRLRDEPDIQATHDGIASMGEAPAMAAGDVAHRVHLGVDDTREFLAIDVWTSSDNIQDFYSNPDLVAAFGMLFDGAPTLGVYTSTDWYQW